MPTTTTGYKTTDIGNLFVSYSDFVASQPVATLSVYNPLTTTGTSTSSNVVTTSSSTESGLSSTYTSDFYYGNVKFIGSYTNTDTVVLVVKENTAVSLIITATPNTQVNANINYSNYLVYTTGIYVIASPTDGSTNATSIIITINDIYETTSTTTNVVGQDWTLSNYWYNSGYQSLSTTTSGIKTTFPGGLSLALANNAQAYSNFWYSGGGGTFPVAGVNFTDKQCVFPNIQVTNNWSGGGGCDLDQNGNNLYMSMTSNNSTNTTNMMSMLSIYNLPSIQRYDNNLSSSASVKETSPFFTLWLQNEYAYNGMGRAPYNMQVQSRFPLSVTSNNGSIYAVAGSMCYMNYNYENTYYPCIIYVYALNQAQLNASVQPSTYIQTLGTDGFTNSTNYALMCVGTLASTSAPTTIVNSGINSDGYYGIVFFPTKVYNINCTTSLAPVWVPSLFYNGTTQITPAVTTGATNTNIVSGSLSQSSGNAICIDTGVATTPTTAYVYWSQNYGLTFDNIPTPSVTIDSITTSLTIANCTSCAVSPDGLQVIITTSMVNNVAQSWTGTWSGGLTFTWVYTTLTTGGINYSISNVTFDKNSISTNTGAVGYSPELSRFVTTSNSSTMTYATSSL